MNSESILTTDLLDILFDKRNKTYGAYILRKFYPNRIKKALLIMLGLVLLFSAFTILPQNKKLPSGYRVEDAVLFAEPPVEKKQLVARPRQKMGSVPVKSKERVTNSMLIVPDKDSTAIFQDISNLLRGNQNIIVPPGLGTGSLLQANEGYGVVNVPGPADPEERDYGPVGNPDVQASFPGGEKELIKFLQSNLRSPRDLEEGELVEVKIKYVVGFDGNLQSFTVLKDGGEAFNLEVIRVLKKMPKWNPGKKGGQNVPVYYTIPVKFTTTE